MRKLFTSMLLVASLILTTAQSFSIDKYQIATWYGYTGAAVSYTFDDNCTNQTKIIIPIFNEFGFTGTFNPVVNWGPSWSAFAAAAELGHEIGCHTMNHPSLGQIPVDSQRYEISTSVDRINQNVPAQKVITIAYPNCVLSDAELNKQYFIAGRNCQGTVENSTPANFYNISSIICGSNGSVKTSADFIDRATRALSKSGWVVYLIHGIDGDGGYSNISSKTIRKSLEYFDTLRADYWVTTFGNAAKYIYERNSASVTELGVYTDSISVEVTDTLVNSIFDQPLTLRTELPQGWEWAEAKQVSQTVNIMNCKVVTVDEKKYIQFDAVPDGGQVTLKKTAQPVSVKLEQNMPLKVGPNPFNNSVSVATDGNFSYTIYSLQGQIMETGNAFNHSQMGETLRSGIYLLNVTSQKGSRVVKIMKQ